MLQKLATAGLGHSDLHLGNFIVKDGTAYLLDGYAVHRNGLRLKDLLLLGTSAQPFMTRSDLHRAWKALGPNTPPPRRNPRSPLLWRRLQRRIFHDDRYFGHLSVGEWTGHFFKHAKFPHRWSSVSRMDITEAHWQEAWPRLLSAIDAGQFEDIKH